MFAQLNCRFTPHSHLKPTSVGTLEALVSHAAAVWNEPGHPSWYSTNFDSHEAAIGRIVAVANADEFPRPHYTASGAPQAHNVQLPVAAAAPSHAAMASTSAEKATPPTAASPAVSEGPSGVVSADTVSIGASTPGAAAVQKRRRSLGAVRPRRSGRDEKQSRSLTSEALATGMRPEGAGTGDARSQCAGEHGVSMQLPPHQQLPGVMSTPSQLGMEGLLAMQQLPPALQQVLLQAWQLQQAQVMQGPPVQQQQPQQSTLSRPQHQQQMSQPEAQEQAASGQVAEEERQLQLEGGAGSASTLGEALSGEGTE
jgi:hypothetical protein